FATARRSPGYAIKTAGRYCGYNVYRPGEEESVEFGRSFRYVSSKIGSMARQLYFASKAARPRAPIAADSAGESMRVSSARLRASRSPYRTAMPQPTSRTISAAAVSSDTSTGFENIIASKSLFGAARRLFGTAGS